MFQQRYDPNTAQAQPQADATNAANSQQQQEQAALQAAHAAAANSFVDQGGSNVGSYGYMGSAGYNPYESNALRPDQSNIERIDQQVGNYMYGGYAGGAADAAAAARDAVAPAAYAMGKYGAAYLDQAQVGAGMYGMGTAGLYGQANALNQYAQQGPGASVAQAQLQMNNAQAQRQQLQLAASGRGPGGAASQYRQAAANQAMMSGQANQQAAMLQAQEAQDWRNAQLQAYGQAGQLYGQGAGIGSQYATGMGDLASQATQGSGQMSLAGEELANQINVGALQGTTGYEQNLTDIYGINKGQARQPDGPTGWDYALYGAGKVLDYAL